jgi:ribosomal protein L31
LEREELTIVANTTGATVIFLQSHPLWTAAQRHERERNEAMRRHPAFRARQRVAASGGEIIPLIRDFKLYSSTNTPA